MKSFLKRLIAVTIVFALTTTACFAEERVVRVYNWSEYIDETILDDFTKATGIKVIYDVYDNNNILETKLLAGKSGYDLVFPTGNFFARQIQAGVFQKLDKSQLPNWKNLDPDIMGRLGRYDPGNEYGVIYMWGTTGIAYNDQKIRERMPNAPVDSWAMLFDPKVASKFADCGIYILDAPEDVIPAALNYLKLDPNAKDAATMNKAEPVLMGMRPSVRKFNSENIDVLANGDICLTVTYSGDALQAAARAEEAGRDFTILYSIPKEGTNVWFDVMAIPKDAPHPKEALAFMNFLMDPKIIARATNYVTYPNANAASKPYIDEEILNDPTIYPSAEVMSRLYVVTPNDQKTDRVMNSIWQKVRTGN